ncbi:MAG: hypothetical protein IPH13_10535 [Planctomycetes bacterium]|nr:hypothetical protein [Planctomycetota bacterium]MCC7173464.1 hypothetical protein [Planctomycetota bacterium]
MSNGARAGRHARERGIFTFVEILLATLVLALAATATAYWVESVNELTTGADEAVVGDALVKTMEEILAPLPFREPGGTTFGPEPGETLATYDDLDDFYRSTYSPPLNKDRGVQADYGTWTITVSVTEVDPTTLLPAVDTDMVRVKVTATRKDRVITEGYWLRARAALE